MAEAPRPTNPHAEGFASAAKDLVDEVQDTIRDDEPEAKEPPKQSLVAPLLLGVVFAGVTIWNVTSYRAGPEPLSAVEAKQAEGVMVFLATQAVEGFAADNGRFPASLAEAGIDAPHLIYTVSGDGFTVTSTEAGVPVRFEKGEVVDDFLIGLGISPPDSTLPGGEG